MPTHPTPLSSPTPPTEVGGLGTLLRRAREQGGLTLEQVARETKIPPPRLAELERDDLPRGERDFYQRAQIRAYARAIKLGESVVLAELDRETPADPAPAREEPKPGKPPAQAQRIVLLMVCAAVAVVVGRALWQFAAAGVGNSASHTSPSQSEGGHDDTRQIAAIGNAGAGPAPSSGESNDVTRASAMEDAQVRNALAVVQASQSSVDDSAPQEDVGRTSTLSAVTELVVTTQPADARVTVNGVGWGATPITIRHLAPGAKRIRVTKDGYIAAERVVGVVSDRSTNLTIQLQPAP